MLNRTVDDYENRWALPDWHGALLWARARNAQGIKAVLDILGESSNEAEAARAATEAYLHLISNISRERLFASVSIKLSALGFVKDKSVCLQNALAIAKAAGDAKVGFEIDMEGRSMVEFTLDAAKACEETGYPTTVALQAYLDRSAGDLQALISNGVRVRLVKGAYAGDTDDYADIQGRFKKLVRVLMDSGRGFCLGTHDPELIVWSTVKLAEMSDKVEFGMLKGLSDMTKLDFVRNKWHVSEYIPYGESKAAYEDRRRLYLNHLAALGREPAP